MDSILIHLCDCGGHGVAVSRVDYDGDGKEVDVELAVWQMGRHDKCCCWQCRLRHIWYILRYGTPYPDDWLSISREKARELAEHIMEAAA
jgi:hypothetical protein